MNIDMNKFQRLMRSRKFWALIAAVAAIVSGYLAGGLSMSDAIQALIAALAAYMVGTGLDNGSKTETEAGQVRAGQRPAPTDSTVAVERFYPEGK